AERLAYIKHWNETLQAELQLTDSEAATVAECTDRFSFAYLKELFLSSMMQWVGNQESDQPPARMGNVLLKRARLLREQLSDRRSDAPKVIQAAGGQIKR